LGEVLKRFKGGKFLGYYLRWYEGGRRRQRASKQPTYAEAKRMLQAIEGRIARGLAGLDEPAGPCPTVAELCERFLAEYARPRIKDLDKYRSCAGVALRRALPLLAELRADQVKPADIVKVRDTLLSSYAENSVRLTLAALGTLYSWAIKGELLQKNPARGVELPDRKDAIEYLSVEEVRALLLTAQKRALHGSPRDKMLYAAVFFVTHVGVRKGELAALRWRDLCLESRRLDISRSFEGTPKSGKARHLRLPAPVVPMLREWQRDCPLTDEGLVFPQQRRDGSWSMVKDSSDMVGLPALMKAAGCRSIRRAWHALRHTFASHYMMAGGSLLALSKILGHADVKITMVYAHLAPDYIGAEMDRVRY
jgi:site-specific recombinase XerD